MKGRRGKRQSPGDPRLRVALFLLVGALLLYASFNHGPGHRATQARIGKATRADEAAVSERASLLTSEHRKALEGVGPVVISAPETVRVSDLSQPGKFFCAVGLVVNNNSGQDVADLEFGIRYSGASGGGSTVHSLMIGGLDIQPLTPVNAAPGSCEGLSGTVSVYRCAYVNGGNCASLVTALGDGAVPLTRAR